MLTQLLLATTAILLLIVFFVYLKYIYRIYKAKKLGLQLALVQFIPHWWPVLPDLVHGIGFDKKDDVSMDYFEKTGAPMVAWIDAERMAIDIRDPQLIKEVAITKHKLFPKPPEAYGVLDLFGSNILTSNGEYWEKHRRIVGPHFSVEKHLRKIHEASVTHAKTMLSLWEKEHNLVTVKDYLQHFTLDVIGSAAFGYELHALLNMKLSDYPKEEIPEGVTLTFNQSLQNILNAAIIYYIVGHKALKYLPFAWARKFYNSIEDFNKYIDFLMKTRREKKEERYDLLSMMLNCEGLTDQEVKSNTFIFFIAGHETTATALHWAIYHLALSPHVQQKLFDEVDSVLQGRAPEYEDIDKLKYTLWVIKETLRLHPPVRAIPKTTAASVKLGGVKLPKNTDIYLHAAAAHRHPSYWEKPNDFIPERFDESKNVIAPFTYFPFSLGRRNCVGQKFALIEARICLAMIMQKYSIRFADGVDPKLALEGAQHLTTGPKHDLHISFVPRKEKSIKDV